MRFLHDFFERGRTRRVVEQFGETQHVRSVEADDAQSERRRLRRRLWQSCSQQSQQPDDGKDRLNDSRVNFGLHIFPEILFY